MKVEANKTYIGVVEDNNDPKKLGRVKVRVLDVYDNLKVEDIPFATPWKDLNGNEFNVPEKGKVLVVVFDQGDEHKPEYIAADHYNINLEKKLQSLSNTDYISMKSLIFDHKTQIYVNDSEGLKIDHKYNNVNITENTIDLNLKDNNRHVNIGDATAGQQAILGNHWMDWFDEFVDNLMGNNGGPYLGNLGAPVVANPALIQVLMKYKALRDPVFLSHHVNIVDNNKVSTVKNTKRQDIAQVGDNWTSTKQENNLTAKTNENFKPVDGPKPEYNDKHVEQPLVTQPNAPTTANVVGTASGTASATIGENKQPVANSADANPPAEPASSPLSNPKIDKMINFMKSKGYKVYDAPNVLNMVAFMSAKKDKGEVSNKFDDILNVLTNIDNVNTKEKVLKYLQNINKKEDKVEDKIENSLEKELKQKDFNEEITEYISLLSSKYNITEELESYLKSNKLLSFSDLGKNGNLYNLIKTKTDFPEGFIKRIIGYTPSEGNKSLGIGEIALALFFDAKKQKVGDIKIDNKMVELKGTEARFPTASGKGRSGDISNLYDELNKKYPDVALPPKQSSLSNYIKLIAEKDPKILDFINNELNVIYPKTDDIKITLQNTNKDINKKYIASYVRSHPENDYYMLISKYSPDYTLYTGDELIKSVEEGNVTFTGNVSKSTSYPQLDI